METDDDEDTVWESIGLEFEEVFPTRLRAGLLQELDQGLRLKRDKWESLPNVEEKLQFNQIRKKGMGRENYICIGTNPLYDTPLQQILDPKFGLPKFHAANEDLKIRRCFLFVKLDSISSVLYTASAPPTPAPAPSAPPTPVKPNLQPSNTTAQVVPPQGGCFPVVTPQHCLLGLQNATVLSPSAVLHPPTPAPIMATEDSLHEFWGIIDAALGLDMEIQPRPGRDEQGRKIELHRKKNADETTRLWVLTLAEQWGWDNKNFSFRERQKVARAACKQIAYNLGWIQLPACRDAVEQMEGATGAGAFNRQSLFICSTLQGRTAYVDNIEELHPGYL